MNIPTPAALGRRPTMAIAAPCGWIAPEQLQTATATGRAPVILRRLGNEKARQQRGPRELREESVAALEKAGWSQPWGLGAVCRTTEDAAHFATAGYTWFLLDLSDHLEPRAGSMTLEELDAAIVALEDSGAYREGWHERYLGDRAGTTVKFTDETLARSAVRFGAALAEAEQMVQAIRVSSSERGDLPDLELSIAGTRLPTTPADLAFFTTEILGRSLVHGGASRFAPSFGDAGEPGAEPREEIAALISQLSEVAPAAAVLSVPYPLATATSISHLHWNAEHASIFAWLTRLATTNPPQFRKWLAAARDLFPVEKTGWHISTSEDETRFLPEVPDHALVPTFLETTQGRQLLLVTWQEVADSLGCPE